MSGQGRRPLSLEMFRQMAQERFEHLKRAVEGQGGGLYDHKDFFLPAGSVI